MKNRHLKTGIMVCLALCWAIFITGCSSKTEQPDPNKTQGSNASNADKNIQANESKSSSSSLTAVSTDNEVAVTVNGVKITEAQVDALIDPMIRRLMASGQQLPPQFMQQYRQRLRTGAVDRLIINNLLDAEVKKTNTTVSDEEIMKQITDIAASQKMTIDEFKARVQQVGQDFDKVKEDVRKGLLYVKVAEKQWEGKDDVSDAEVKAYFDEHQADFNTPEMVRASHILIKPDPADDPNEAKSKALAKTQDILKQVKDGGNFAELAKANSACSSSAQGGDLDFFPKGQMVKPFEDAAFSMKIGEISDVVETQFGYHIIKVTDHKDATKPTFEDIKDKIIEQLKTKKQAEIADEYIKSLKDKATIVYPPGKEPAPAEPAFPGAVQ